MPLPKSSSKERIVSNSQIFDFELDREELEQLSSLDEGLPVPLLYVHTLLILLMLSQDFRRTGIPPIAPELIQSAPTNQSVSRTSPLSFLQAMFRFVSVNHSSASSRASGAFQARFPRAHTGAFEAFILVTYRRLTAFSHRLSLLDVRHDTSLWAISRQKVERSHECASLKGPESSLQIKSRHSPGRRSDIDWAGAACPPIWYWDLRSFEMRMSQYDFTTPILRPCSLQ